MIAFYYMLTIGDETRRIPIPASVGTDEDAVTDYVTSDAAWETGEIVSAEWPRPLPSPE